MPKLPVAALAMFAAHTMFSAPAAAQPAMPDPHAEAAPAAEEDGPLVGPQKIALGHELTLELPEGLVFFNPVQAGDILTEMGNVPGEGLLGIATREESDWFVVLRFDADGYVRDDDAAGLDADAILGSLREGTEEANKSRAARGFPPVHIDGWAEVPRYERAAHHMVWAVTASSERGRSVNFNTRVLGRRGYASLNLVTDPELLDTSKPEVEALLQVTRFDPGARYEDFEEKTDKISEYGLTALVAGGAGAAALKAAKVGVLAKFGKVLLAAVLAGKKLILVGLMGLVVVLKKIFGAKGEPPAV